MCQIVIHIADTGDHELAEVNHARFKKGDIVAILPDDHIFGALDLGPHNKLVKLPNIDAEEIEHLVGQDPSPSHWSPHHWRVRVWNLPNWQWLLAEDSRDAVTFIKSAVLRPMVYRKLGE